MLNYLLYYLVILPISILPFPVLYFISNFVFFMMYRVFGYRKQVVFQNLRNSFPEKSEQEIKQIGKKFYKHLCDLIVESIKTFTISERQVQKRMKAVNPELVDSFFEQGKSVILVGGHYSNWELYAVAVDAQIKHEAIALYSPLKNKFFDEKMRKTRSKYGLSMVSTKKIKPIFSKERKKPMATIFASDQSPGSAKKAYWMEFLNQDTGVLFGVEKYAKEYDHPVIFGAMRKLKRGHYEVEYSLVNDNPTSADYGKITEAHTKILEDIIIKRPEFWLWSHKRWKKKRPTDL